MVDEGMAKVVLLTEPLGHRFYSQDCLPVFLLALHCGPVMLIL